MQLEYSCCSLAPLVVFLALISSSSLFSFKKLFPKMGLRTARSKQTVFQLSLLVIINRLTTLQRRLRVLFCSLPLFNGFTYWSTKVAVYVL